MFSQRADFAEDFLDDLRSFFGQGLGRALRLLRRCFRSWLDCRRRGDGSGYRQRLSWIGAAGFPRRRVPTAFTLLLFRTLVPTAGRNRLR